MADQRRIKLYSGHASPNTIILRDLPIADAAATTKIILYDNHATAQNVILRDPTVVTAASGDFTALPGAGQIVSIGQAPALSVGATLSPAAASIVAAGSAPTISASFTAASVNGEAILTGQASAIAAGATLTPAASAAILAGQIPVVSAGAVISSASGQVIVTGLAPELSLGLTLSIGASAAALTGYEPTLSIIPGAASARSGASRLAAHKSWRPESIAALLGSVRALMGQVAQAAKQDAPAPDVPEVLAKAATHVAPRPQTLAFIPSRAISGRALSGLEAPALLAELQRIAARLERLERIPGEEDEDAALVLLGMPPVNRTPRAPWKKEDDDMAVFLLAA